MSVLFSLAHYAPSEDARDLQIATALQLAVVVGGNNAITTSDSVSVVAGAPGATALSEKSISDIKQRTTLKQLSFGAEVSLGSGGGLL